MAVGTYNYTWEQGSDLPVQIIYKEGDPAVAVDLTADPPGYAVRMDIRVATVSGALVYTFNSVDIEEIEPDDLTQEVTLGAAGEINIQVPRSLTLLGGTVYDQILLGQNVFFYDIFLRKVTPDTQIKLLQGTITVNKSATLWLETEATP
jgi:hypothetical protein